MRAFCAGVTSVPPVHPTVTEMFQGEVLRRPRPDATVAWQDRIADRGAGTVRPMTRPGRPTFDQQLVRLLDEERRQRSADLRRQRHWEQGVALDAATEVSQQTDQSASPGARAWPGARCRAGCGCGRPRACAARSWCRADSCPAPPAARSRRSPPRRARASLPRPSCPPPPLSRLRPSRRRHGPRARSCPRPTACGRLR